jgi:23S rRNA pseudoU1915 N3-methylase RlmH
MGMKVTIRIVGRKSGSEKWLEEACKMYETRLRPANIDVDTQWHKNNDALIKGVQGDFTKGVPVVLLDPVGGVRTSEALAAEFYDWLEEGGSRLIFVIGGGKYRVPSNEYIATLEFERPRTYHPY